MFDVANWVACINGENGPGGTPSHEALSVSPQGVLEISSVVGQPPSLDRNHFSPPRMVAESHKCDEKQRLSSQRPQYPTLYRRLQRRLGPSLRANLFKEGDLSVVGQLPWKAPWTETISAHPEWWQNPTNVMKSKDFHPKDHSIQLFTDASNEGWGAPLEQTSSKGCGQTGK